MKIYEEDLQIAKALIQRDEGTTRKYFYQGCYPLFKYVYDNYYTDCNDVKEFMDEIYLLTLAPSKVTGKCQLENFRGESTLASWLKTACLYYCYNKFKLKERLPEQVPFVAHENPDDEAADKPDSFYGSVEIDFKNLNRQDALAILNMMPNKRYRNIIIMRYLEQKSNEEIAEALGMSLDNYYNKHRLAKEQYKAVWRKEVKHG